MTSALLTDRYELTMVDAARRAGTADRRSVFELFARRLPAGRRYGVVAGVSRFVELLRDFRFDEAALSWLAEAEIVSPHTLDWLADYRFRGTIRGYRDGELYFPGSPVLTVESSFAEGVILETLALSVLNADSAVASAAARMVQAADGRPIIEMGSRRTHERAAVTAARAAWMVGFASTSNLEAGRSFGVPTAGTAAHSFTLLHDSELEAFRAQVAALGPATTLLIDTFDVLTGVDNAIAAAGTELGAVRIDSGDLPQVAAMVRARLDELGARETRIVVTSDLDEFTIAGLRASPVDAYGVGTSVVTGSGAPTAGMVYKLVAVEAAGGWRSVGKTSTGKASVGGRKSAVRVLRAGTAVSEDIHVEDPNVRPAAADGRPLLVDYVLDGAEVAGHVGEAALEGARAHHAAAIGELPLQGLSLSAGDPAIPTRYL